MAIPVVRREKQHVHTHARFAILFNYTNTNIIITLIYVCIIYTLNSILCHPGPCPPCGAMKTDIKCWSHGNPIAIRCGETSIWILFLYKLFYFLIFFYSLDLSCKNPCKKLLSCGIHSCSLECHDGECKPCDKIRTI